MLEPANELEHVYLEHFSCACLDLVGGLMTGNSWNYNSVHR
jgi:hypothetical protein